MSMATNLGQLLLREDLVRMDYLVPQEPKGPREDKGYLGLLDKEDQKEYREHRALLDQQESRFDY